MIINFLKTTCEISIEPTVFTKLQDFAQKSHPTEAGGILIGWWIKDNIHIEDVIEVTYADATGNSWVREEAQAQAALDQKLETSKDEKAGYVGDWHSHPAPIGASPQDIKSLKRSSKQYKNSLATIVCLSDGSFDIHSARRGRLNQTKLKG